MFQREVDVSDEKAYSATCTSVDYGTNVDQSVVGLGAGQYSDRGDCSKWFVFRHVQNDHCSKESLFQNVYILKGHIPKVHYSNICLL